MNKLWDCIYSKNTKYIPIWFMRQAGRYLPEFIKIRKKNPDFIKLCLNEKLATEISLQPINRFDLDATIVFSDILMIPYGLGQKVEFKKDFGPILGNINLEDILNANPIDFIRKTTPIYKTINKIKNKIKNKNLIGFVGAPWTLLLYMLNKQSPKKENNINKIISDKHLTKKLLKKLEEIVCLHAEKQINAGADVIQIFDSWAGLLPKKELVNYCYVPTLKVVNHIKSLKTPVICFPRGIKENYIEFCSEVKPDCISIDSEIDPLLIKNKTNGLPIQGGLDPKILLGNKEKIKKNVEYYLEIFNEHPYIFNLGHGVLPNTNPKTIEYVIEIIKNYKKK